MQVASGTLVVVYYGVFFYIFYLINHAARMQQAMKLVASAPALLFVTIFPYLYDGPLFVKFLLTIIGFFVSFNIVDLVYLEPVEHMTFKEYMFYLSTSSRYNMPIKQTPQKGEQELVISARSVNIKGLLRLAKAAGKFLVLSTIFESIQKWEIERSYLEYYTFMYLVGACLYLMFNVLLDVVGLFWEFTFNMKPKELFRTPFIASSPRDFWSRRWNMFFRDFFHKIFFKNVKNLTYLRSIVSALAIFVISGLLHEYVYWSIMGKVSGLKMMFFLVHGVVTTLQTILQTLFPVLKKVPTVVAVPLNTVFLALTIPLFISPYVHSGFIRNVKLPLSLTPALNSAVAELSSLYA
jgi:hypothetical protein